MRSSAPGEPDAAVAPGEPAEPDADPATPPEDGDADGFGPQPRPGPAARAALATIRGYKRFVSPLMPPACRFVPTCSEYGYEAIARYGIITGGRMALWRILRCNPFGRGGYDPVP